MALIKTIDELVKYVEANSLSDIATIKPSIRTAERRGLVPVLGEAQYLELTEAYNEDPQDLSPTEQGLLDLSQEAVANLAMALAVSRLAVQFGDSGIRRPVSDTQQTAYQYQEVNLRESFEQAGYDVLEDLLAYLDTNKANFTAWAASDAFADYKSYFIPSGIVFSKYYATKQSRLCYISMRYIMKKVENFTVKDIVGPGLFTALKTAQKANTLSAKYAALLDDYICPGIALLTVATGLLQRAIEVSDKGVTVSLLGITKNSQERNPAPDAKTAAMAQSLITDATEYFNRLSTELAANPDDYPDYVAPAATSALLNIKNKQENGIYGV